MDTTLAVLGDAGRYVAVLHDAFWSGSSNFGFCRIVMKWISVLGCLAVVSGLAMVLAGQNARGMKAESREGLILYGMLLCSIAVVWFVIHGMTALLRKDSKTNDQN
jgi:hypothetical protein